MKQSSIYNMIDNPARKSDCSFGASRGFIQIIKVGTSSTNSHHLAKLTVSEAYGAQIDMRTFVLTFDGYVLKRGILRGKAFVLESAQFNIKETP